MRGSVAKQLRRMVKAVYSDRVVADYEYKPFTHGGQERDGTTRTLTIDCQRHAYKGVKKQWREGYAS